MELMMVLVLVAILMGLAVPSFHEFQLNSRMTGAANDLLASFQRTRSEAIKRQRPVQICASSDPASTPACSGAPFSGWLVWADQNENSALDAPAEVLEIHAPLEGLTVLSGLDRVTYTAAGFPQNSLVEEAILICDERGERRIGDNYVKRAISFGPTGRPTVLRSVAEVDAAGPPDVGACP